MRLALSLLIASTLSIGSNVNCLASDIVTYVDPALANQVQDNVPVPPEANAHDDVVIDSASEDAPKAALMDAPIPVLENNGPEQKDFEEIKSDKETFYQSPSSKFIQAEVHKDVKEKIINAMLDQDIALAVPSPSLFQSVGEQIRVDYSDEPIVIDNDEVVEVQSTIKYKEMPTDDGKTKILAGAKFPVVVCSQINSKTAQKGDPFEARLKYDLKIGDRLIAPKGSKVTGHLDYVLRARCTMHSLLSPERWYRNSGCIGVAFDEVVNDKGEHYPLIAKPAQTARIIKNKGEGRVLGVNHEGQVTGPWSQQLRYKAIRVGLNFAMAPAGIFSFGAMPLALGVIGAANPSFAFMKPVGLNVRHRRLKGFAWGFLSGVPGSFLIEDTVIKGQEAIVKPGDEFLAEFKEEFTGEPATEASLIAGAKTKVEGQVMPKASRQKKLSQSSANQSE